MTAFFNLLCSVQFKQVIGQKQTKSHLVQMNQQNRLSHALLFLGKEGSGALSLARAFAQYMVCEKINPRHSADAKKPAAEVSLFGDPTPAEESIAQSAADQTAANDSCGICPGCTKAAKGIHPDIHFTFPVFPLKSGDKPVSADFIHQWREFMEANPYGNSYDWLQFAGAENKQGNITAEECNEIIKKMSLKSFESAYKILIIWMPELLGKEGNKLLKLIEEPAPDSLFILVAENETLILPTILSRTQLIKIPPLNKSDIEAALELREGLSIPKAEQIAMISEGNYHEALLQLQHSDDDWELLLRDWLNSIIKTGPAAQVKWIDEISKTGREKQKQFLKFFIHLLEKAIRIRVMGETNHQQHLPGNEKQDALTDFALRLNKLCDITQQEAIIRELDQASYYIERNANAKILFHALTIKLYHIISNKTVILMQ